MSDLELNINKAMDMAYEANRKIDSHEDICALRYKGISDGMDRIVKDLNTLATRMWIASGSIIGICVLVIITLTIKVK